MVLSGIACQHCSLVLLAGAKGGRACCIPKLIRTLRRVLCWLACVQDLQTAIGKLGLELHKRYPSAVPSNFVWGFGRPLWDPTVRVLGLKPLRIIVLGPAASGKSMQCSMLAERCARCNIPTV